MTVLRIGNCSGYFGDRRTAAREVIEGGELDVLTGDYLAETTMLILARQRLRDASRGYASTFIDHMGDVLGACLDRGIKVVVNAGGLNPRGCADALGALASEAGLNPNVAVVEGDNLLPELDRIRETGWTFPRTGTDAPISELAQPIIAANAYLGAWGIVEALERGADVVVTGRVTDSAIVLGPAAWKYGWALDDWDKLSAGIVAGHLIECSTQVSGGNFAFFDEIDSLRHMGMPIVEIEASGEFVVTKHPGTGGAVTCETVLAQLLYEIGSPAYLTPDVTAHFDSVRLCGAGTDRVRVTSARGSPPPDTLKAIIHYPAGFRNAVDVIIGGGNIDRKVDAFENLFWEAAGGKDAFVDTRTDRFVDDKKRCWVRLAARSLDRDHVGRAFSNSAVELVLASIPGISLATPPRDASGSGGVWSTTVPRDLVTTTVEVAGTKTTYPCPPTVGKSAPLPAPDRNTTTVPRGAPVRLGELCGARSGDKGGDANVGFWVRDPAHYEWMLSVLTEEWLQENLPEPFDGEIERYALPHVHSVNFLLRSYLGGGAASSILIDPQAKFLGEQLRDVVVSGPA